MNFRQFNPFDEAAQSAQLQVDLEEAREAMAENPHNIIDFEYVSKFVRAHQS